jgi:pyruvate dehydrogenase phosphatase regulatory subunit
MMVFTKAYSNCTGNALFAVKTRRSALKTYLGFIKNPICQKYSTNTGILPKNCKVAICGGGVMGASVAYHLAQLGWGPQTIVIEQDK